MRDSVSETVGGLLTAARTATAAVDAAIERVERFRDRLAGGDGSDRIERRQVTAAREDGDDDELVVFLIGMRVNAVWKVHRWLPVALVAPRMVRELRAEDESSLLGSWTFVSGPRTIGFVQYWDSFESLAAYAHDEDGLHRDAWTDYYRNRDDGAVGIWHETYRVDDDETVYNNAPPRGLGAADGSELVSATGERESAAGRLGESDPFERPE